MQRLKKQNAEMKDFPMEKKKVFETANSNTKIYFGIFFTAQTIMPNI